jgi:4'-phosphopantetheinyl transferase
MSGRSLRSRKARLPGAGGGPPTDGRIDLWYADLRHDGWPRLFGLLSEQEHRRAQAFAFAREIRRYVVSHAILRTLLGGAIGTPAPDVRLRTEIGRKPALEPENCDPVHFSLSRSGELVVIGLAPRPLGVDIERLAHTMDVEDLAAHVLTSRERTAFEALDPASRPTAFLRCWTRKEAYLKAIGMGLAIPPTAVEVCFEAGRLLGAEPISDGVESAFGWFIDNFAPIEGYLGAVAIQSRPWRLELNAFDTGSL